MLTLSVATVVVCGQGCYGYRDIVDPCYPERYEYMARKEVKALIALVRQLGSLTVNAGFTDKEFHYDLRTRTAK